MAPCSASREPKVNMGAWPWPATISVLVESLPCMAMRGAIDEMEPVLAGSSARAEVAQVRGRVAAICSTCLRLKRDLNTLLTHFVPEPTCPSLVKFKLNQRSVEGIRQRCF